MLLQKRKINWINPLNLAKKIAANYGLESWVFLYSGLSDEIKNSRSIIALFPKNEKCFNDIKQLQSLDFKNKTWFGYISYEANQTKNLTKKSFINLPKIWLINFELIFEFNHDKKTVEAYFSRQELLDEVLNYAKIINVKNAVKITNLKSNFTDKKYLQEIKNLQKMIADGDFYQANLTRKFFGTISFSNNKKSNISFSNRLNYFNLFTKLTKSSAANYSSFLQLKDNFIISSSPELFLSIKNDQIISRPIKGTAPRSPNAKQDLENKKNLQNSLKEKAENLMIVDLVRNDISRVCKAGSVKVKNLFLVNSYKTLHHMSSEIIGKIDKKFNIIDCILACFPAGSMTGAPKIKAVETLAKKEKIDRGIYSGAIGYLKQKETNLSVVIRTLICKKDKFEFQAGGAITFDSNPQKELEETKIKTKAIRKILTI